MNSELNPLFAHFAHELERLRVKRGWSQEALGRRIGFSGEMVSKVETGRNAPSPEFADALDRLAFSELEGMFCELLDSAATGSSAPMPTPSSTPRSSAWPTPS